MTHCLELNMEYERSEDILDAAFVFPKYLTGCLGYWPLHCTEYSQLSNNKDRALWVSKLAMV